MPSGDVHLTSDEGRLLVFEPNGSGGFERPLEFTGVLSEVSAGVLRVTFTDGEVWDFDAAGLLVSKTRWDGVSAVVSRDGQDRVDRVTASTGEWVGYSYDGAGRLDGVVSSDARSVAYGFDATSGFLTSVTGVDGETTLYVPDAVGRVDSIIDPTGVTVVDCTYHPVTGQVISQVSLEGTTTFAYDAEARTTTVSSVEVGDTVVYSA
ncbi:MAG: hypothetical protein M5U19_00255 [Microthrixaceae bacterium]|nr:hypothetical protein [Microthrixaceae bacterium]